MFRYILLFSLFSATTFSVAQEPVVRLSREGEIRRSAHQFLVGPFSSNRRTKVIGSGDASVLDEITVSEKQITIEGESTFSLPAGAQRVASMFRYLVLLGDNLDAIEHIHVLPFAPDSQPHASKQEKNFFRVQMPSLPLPTESMETMQLQLECRPGVQVKIDKVEFHSQGRLRMKFNEIPFRNLGAEHPREQVKVKVDPSHELSVSGHTDLERDKWFRYYAAPGSVPQSFETWALERNFKPGRQIFKMQPALVKGYSKNQPKLAELPGKKGAADLSFFSSYDSSAGLKYAVPALRDVRYAMCLDEWPEFMSRKPNGRGTPLLENFDDAAELAAAFVADQVRDAGRTASWWEVKNESTIKAEWDYHWEKEVDGWGLVADFHNRVADAIHRSSPGAMVGGPASAWMQLQVNDFELYRNQRDFMDETKGHLDFYSHHFYEDIGSLGAFENRKTIYTNYLLGRLEGILNMIQAHMHGSGNVKPILITECGSLQAGRAPSDNWLRLRSYNGYLVKMMQRPEQIDLVVPFVFLTIPWNPDSGDAAFFPKPGKRPNGPLDDFEPTPIADFFELWRDFDGRRLPVNFDQPFLDVVAVHRDATVQVAITNMGGRRLAIDLSELGKYSRQVTQKRLYYHDGEVLFENDRPINDASSIPVNVEETTVVTFHQNESVRPLNTIRKDSWYASDTAVSLNNGSSEFQIAVGTKQPVESCELVIGVHRDGGLIEPLQCSINDHVLKPKTNWAKDMNNLFAPVHVIVPKEWVGKSNKIKIAEMKGLTITSVHLETLSSE